MTKEDCELSVTYLKEMQEDYIEGEGYERHPLPEYFAIEYAIKALEKTDKLVDLLNETIDHFDYTDAMDLLYEIKMIVEH